MKLPKEECPISELEKEQDWDLGADFPHGRSGHHRHVTNQESISSHKDNTRVCGNWRLVVGTFLINLIMPSLVSSFGVFMLHMADHIPLNLMYIVPVINVTCCTFFEPLCRHLLYVFRFNRVYLLVTGVAFMAVVMFNSLNQCIGVMITTYGVGTGIGSCIVGTYTAAMLQHHSPTNRGMAVALNHVATAAGYIVMPMAVHMLMENYDFGKTAAFQAMVATPLITIAICILPAWNPRHPACDDGSITALDRSNNFLMHNLGTSWQNPSQVSRSQIQCYRDNYSNRIKMSRCRSPVFRARKRSFPVDIMPRIVEETEDAVDNNTITGTVTSEMREDDQFLDANVIIDNPDFSTEIENPFTNNSVQSEELQIDKPRYCLYNQVTMRANTFIINPLISSLTTPYFFPVLWSKFARRFCSMSFTALLPSLSKALTPSNSNESCVAGLVIAAFAQLCMLTASPFFKRMPNKYHKWVLMLGCVAQAIGFYVLTYTLAEDYVRVGCTLYGIGISMTIVVTDSMGFRNQTCTAVVLDVLCTILIILAAITVLTVWMTAERVSNSFHVLAAIQVVSATMWLGVPLIRLAMHGPRMGIEETLMPTH